MKRIQYLYRLSFLLLRSRGPTGSAPSDRTAGRPSSRCAAPDELSGAACDTQPEGSSEESPSSPSGILRWVVDISRWTPAQPEWDLLLRTLPRDEQAKVMRFLREAVFEQRLAQCRRGTGAF